MQAILLVERATNLETLFCHINPLWNNEKTLNGLAQKVTTDFYNLETKPMQPGKKILKFNDGPFYKSRLKK